MRIYLPNEIEARTAGKISLGAGAIYPVPESEVVCEPFRIPVHYRHVYGLDVGWNRTAAAWLAIDDETDVAYVYAEHYRGQAEPAIHAQAIRAKGDWIPGVIDPASRGRDPKDGTQLMLIYQNLGLKISPADNRVKGDHGGIAETWGRLSSGRLKVFRTCQNWLMEFRLYRRDEKGKIVKANDHLMDATRYAIMSGMGLATSSYVANRQSEQPFDAQGRMTIGRRPDSRHRFEYEPFAEQWAAAPEAPRANSPWARR